MDIGRKWEKVLLFEMHRFDRTSFQGMFLGVSAEKVAQGHNVLAKGH